jgi:hypothetical protein
VIHKIHYQIRENQFMKNRFHHKNNHKIKNLTQVKNNLIKNKISPMVKLVTVKVISRNLKNLLKTVNLL